MSFRRGLVVCGAFFYLCASAFAQANFTGTWSGPYSGTSACNGSQVSQSGSATVELVQNGSSVAGALIAMSAATACDPGKTRIYPVNATISGSTIVFTFYDQGVATVTMTVNGTSMSMTVAGSDFVVSGILSQASAQPPASDFTGRTTARLRRRSFPATTRRG